MQLEFWTLIPTISEGKVKMKQRQNKKKTKAT